MVEAAERHAAVATCTIRRVDIGVIEVETECAARIRDRAARPIVSTVTGVVQGATILDPAAYKEQRSSWS